MKAVKVAEFKAKLSAHLKYVRSGEEIIICEREKPIARILPIHAEDYSEQEQRLIARGLISPPLKPAPETWPMPTGKMVSAETMERVWREERDGR